MTSGVDLDAILGADPGRGLAPPLDPAEDGIEEVLNRASEPSAQVEQTHAPLAWRWADELAAAAPEKPEWILEGYLAPGTKTIIAGLPKAGKTTLVAALIEATACEADSFLGRTVKGGPVILASEEGDLTLAPKLRTLPPARVRVLNRDACWPPPTWPELISGAIAEAQRIGACLLVIDSLAFWAALEGDRENDAGTAQGVLAALDQACRADLAVLLVHHQRKSPGANHGTGVRGSGAIAGAVDVVLEYERLGEEAPPSQRRLVALSRWPTTPDVLVLDYDREDGTWRVVGEAGSRDGASLLGIRERLLAAVSVEPPGASEQEIAELVNLDGRKVGSPLRELLDEGEIERAGKGKKGDPYRYHRKAPPDSPPAQGSIGDSNAPLPLKGGSIESNSSPEIPPVPGEKTEPGGCPSHTQPVKGCRYCAAGGTE